MTVQEFVAAFEQSLKMPDPLLSLSHPSGAHGYFLMMFLTSRSRKATLSGLKLRVELDAPDVFCIKISSGKS